MKRIRLDIDGEGNVNFIENTEGGTELYIPSYGVVKAFKIEKGVCKGPYKSRMDMPKDFTVDFYLLEKVEYIANPQTVNAAVCLSYQLFDESDSVRVYFAEKDGLVPEECDIDITLEASAAEYFKKICGYLPSTRATSSFFRGMITAHYRYHNVLALSVVDAIGNDRGAKSCILNEFVRSDEKSFKEALEPIFKTLERALGEYFSPKLRQKRFCIRKLLRLTSIVRIAMPTIA